MNSSSNILQTDSSYQVSFFDPVMQFIPDHQSSLSLSYTTQYPIDTAVQQCNSHRNDDITYCNESMPHWNDNLRNQMNSSVIKNIDYLAAGTNHELASPNPRSRSTLGLKANNRSALESTSLEAQQQIWSLQQDQVTYRNQLTPQGDHPSSYSNTTRDDFSVASSSQAVMYSDAPRTAHL